MLTNYICILLGITESHIVAFFELLDSDRNGLVDSLEFICLIVLFSGN